MTRLDDAMEENMAYLVLSEGRPFSYRDFLKFNIDGKEYTMSHGTFRNKISKLNKDGKVELSYYSSCAFYTLKDHKFGKPMTPNRAVIHNNPIYRLIQDHPYDRQSIHDIRLRFKVPNIWLKFSINPNFHRNNTSQDIIIPTWSKDNALVKAFVHKTDIVSVIISCSLQPIPLTSSGIIKFFTLLARVEEKLRSIMDNSNPINSSTEYSMIPDYKKWTIVMWHFGRDGLVEYTGEKFSITIENTQDVLARIYSKDFNGKHRLRIEKQEYPKKTVFDAIDEKLGNNILG